MLTSKSRTALVAVIAAIGVLAVAGTAPATTGKVTLNDFSFVMAHLNKPKKDLDLRFKSSGEVSVVPVIDDADLVAHATAGATGEGTTQEACDTHARLINRRAYEIIAILIGLADDHGRYESAEAATMRMLEEIEETVDDGCSIAYEEGPPPEEDPDPVIL